MYIGYHPRKAFLESLQLSYVTGQNRVGAEVLYYLRRRISLLFELTLVPVILNSRMDQCLQRRQGRTSIPLLNVEALFTSPIWSPAQSVCIAVFVTGSVCDPVRELG